MGKQTRCGLNKQNQNICCNKRDLSKKKLMKIQKKSNLPFCDGSSYPYVKGCFSDMSNWSPPNKDGTPKQCIIINPATTNLQSGSIYTCGFSW